MSEVEFQKISIPHAGIYKRGISPSRCPQAFLPTVPDLEKIVKNQKQKGNNTPNNKFSVKKKTCFSGCSFDLHGDKSNGSNDKLVRRRNRVQVGATNRWRLSFDTGCDLLATTQIVKATHPNKKSKEIYLSSIPSYSTIYHEFSRSSHQESTMTTCISQTKSKRSQKSLNFLNKNKKVSQAILERQIHEMRMYENYVPLEKRIPTPHEIFLKTMHEFYNKNEADIILYALNMEWELSEDAIEGSEVLLKLFHSHDPTTQISNESSDSCMNVWDVSSTSMSSQSTRVDHGGRICLSLQINNPLITTEVFSIALLSLYKGIRAVPVEDVVNVMIVAQLLKIPRLIQLCVDVMLETIKINTVCLYHRVATEYELDDVMKECVSWLEVKLLPTLSSEIYLGHVSIELMLEVLTSQRFFIFKEYSIIQMLCYWIFFLEQKSIGMPSWTTVVTWFMSLPNSKPYLLCREGKRFLPHFKQVRLNGITDPSNVHEIQKMNVLPPQWLLSALQNHYFSLQSGGDMNLMTRFDSGAIRYGLILKRNVAYHSEVIALHGFYFELVAAREDGKCVTYLKRLRPTNSLLSFRICERQTFSIRQDREVRYSLNIQWKTHTGYSMDSLGPTTQIIGFNEITSESQKLTTKTPNTDLYITYALLFPPS